MEKVELYSESMVVSIDITDRCNLQCLHCFNNSGERCYESEMTDDKLMELCDQVIEIRPLIVCICGGEPLLRKNTALKMIKKLKNGGIANVNMVSNGILVTEEIANELDKSGLNLIQISVDGLKENHDWLRNRAGAFESAIKAIELLKAANLNVGVACTPTKKNLQDIEELVDYLDEKGIYDFRMQPIMPLGRAKNIRSYFPDQKDYLILSRKLSSISKRKNGLRVEWGDPTEHIANMVDGLWSKSITIDAYGNVLLSPYIPISFGNINNHSLVEYYRNGFKDIHKIPSVKKILQMMKDVSSMELNDTSLPVMHTTSNLKFDIIDQSFEYINEELFKMIKM